MLRTPPGDPRHNQPLKGIIMSQTLKLLPHRQQCQKHKQSRGGLHPLGTSSISRKLKQRKTGGSVSEPSKSGSKAGTRPAVSTSKNSRRSSKKPNAETIIVDIRVRGTGALLESVEWPLSLWKAGQRLAASSAVSFDCLVSSMLRNDTESKWISVGKAVTA